MRTKYLLVSAVMALTWGHLATADQSKHSNYAGQETRAIKSLSPEDIAELERGGGWGLAKAAELNGLPGPLHLLELKNEIELTGVQVNEIEMLYEAMKVQAVEYGKKLIALEGQLDERFRSNPPTESELSTMLKAIEQARSQLRFIHLSTHLKTPDILTEQQIEAYNELRGYASKDPCDNVPKGHDAKMWRMHNQCE